MSSDNLKRFSDMNHSALEIESISDNVPDQNIHEGSKGFLNI
jgi:hypothetical protein